VNKQIKKALLIASVILAAASFSACNIGMPWDIELLGSWDDGYGTTVTITDTTYENYYNNSLNYSGKILKYDNAGLNADETSDADTYGYFLVELTESNSDWTPVGTCIVYRWKNIITENGVTTVALSEGYGLTRFTDADEALAGMTEADGYFTWYSGYTKTE